MSILQNIESYVSSSTVDYHVFFRERGLALHESYKNNSFNLSAATSNPPEVSTSREFLDLVNTNLEYLSEHFLDLLMSPLSARILWALYCSTSDTHLTVLGKLCPSLANIAQAVRGGPNIYKLNGWIVHVLIGYGIITDYIHRGSLPSTLEWPSSILDYVNRTLRPIYNSLTDINKTILHAGMLGHDIGVSVDITDHNLHGIPLVSSFLEEIRITPETIGGISRELDFDDFTWAVKSIVKYHTFINRVGIEFSIQRSAFEIEQLVQSADTLPWRLTFLREHFFKLLLLVATGDLIAVDDSLFTERKAREMQDSWKFLELIINDNMHSLDPTSAGFKRFQGFLNDDNVSVSKTELDVELTSLGYVPDRFWTSFYHAQEFNFALSLVRFLPAATDALLIFVLIFLFIDFKFPDTPDIYHEIRVVFDHKLDTDVIETNLSDISQFLKSNQFKTLIKQDSLEINGLRLVLTDDVTGQYVFITSH